MLECGVRNQLYSFHRLRTMKQKVFTEMVNSLQDEQERRVETGEPQLRLMLESGAFAYLNSKSKKPDPHIYFREYKECLARTKELWSCITEMNLDSVGQAQISDWRNELFMLHSQVIPVWTQDRGESSWDSYCQDPRYQYLAFDRGLTVTVKTRLCNKAHLAGKLVHGMSETKMQTEVKYLKADSFGSNAWMNAEKYGALYVFHGNQLRLLDKQHKQDRKLFRSYFESSGVDFAQVMSDDPDTINKCSLIAWRNLSTRYEAQGERNGRSNEASNSATNARGNRTATEARSRDGKTNSASKSNVDQRTVELQSSGVNGSDALQGSSTAGAKRPFGFRRVYGDSESVEQGVNYANVFQETDSVRCGWEETAGSRDQRGSLQKGANTGVIRQVGFRHSVTSSSEIVGQESRYCRSSGVVLSAVRLILDLKSGRIVPIRNDDAKAAWGLHLATCTSFNVCAENYPGDDCVVGRVLYKQLKSVALVVTDQATSLQTKNDSVSEGVVEYPQDIEDDVNTLSASMPKTVCDNCAISGECKEYKPGSLCFFDDDFGKLPVRNLDANLAEREVLLKFDRTRLMRAIMAERVSGGGALDGRVSQAMDDYIRRKNDFVALARKRGTSPVTASLSARGKPGIFSSLFGAAMPTGKREEGDTEVPLNSPVQDTVESSGDVEITMTVTKDMPNKKQ